MLNSQTRERLVVASVDLETDQDEVIPAGTLGVILQRRYATADVDFVFFEDRFVLHDVPLDLLEAPPAEDGTANEERTELIRRTCH